MNTKYLITASIFTLVASSVAQAESGRISQESMSVVLPNVVAPSFSWTGFYFGGQIGGFSSKTDLNLNLKGVGSTKLSSIEKDLLPKLSGFMGGLYAGANFDLNNSLVLGVDTDVIWSDKKDTKVIRHSGYKTKDGGHGVQRQHHLQEAVSSDELLEKFIVTVSHTLKQKWAGATRMRVGFAVDHIMPYIAGGVAYTQLQDILLVSTGIKKDKIVDETKAMIGYTFGGGIDFAMMNDLILRAEYRFSNFGKKKFIKDKFEIDYKTNDFRVGVSYKF
ncbi:outer membrane protein [Bartonella schoenbuchensis]|uniref:Hemin binding protein c n=2 Tax=Bartonella schoenbuchensis TaxID=165694 RepID=E6Z001_BARSR|nr:outer membrane protein [Bartonella schoenbuchensis]AQX30903.1 outer membrane immunogenic protein [Bartonella schoenbuchensis R1]CBI82439.1 Hemin binding protein c [Bartonella schoenbuchensis R1]CDP80265.1 hemin binding protein C [Bartonella schoenbuchensis]